MSNSLVLKSFKSEGLSQKAIYSGSHSTGGRGGTVLDFDVEVSRVSHGPWTATIVFDGCKGRVVKDAIARLADWCSRAGETLKPIDDDDDQEKLTLPLSNGNSRL